MSAEIKGIECVEIQTVATLDGATYTLEGIVHLNPAESELQLTSCNLSLVAVSFLTSRLLV